MMNWRRQSMRQLVEHLGPRHRLATGVCLRLLRRQAVSRRLDVNHQCRHQPLVDRWWLHRRPKYRRCDLLPLQLLLLQHVLPW